MLNRARTNRGEWPFETNLCERFKSSSTCSIHEEIRPFVVALKVLDEKSGSAWPLVWLVTSAILVAALLQIESG